MKKLLYLLSISAWLFGCNTADTDVLKETLTVLDNEKTFVWLQYIEVTENGNTILAKAEGIEIYEEKSYLDNLLNYEYQPVEIEKVPDVKSVWLCSDEFTIYGYEGSDLFQLNADGNLYQFQAISENKNVPIFGDNLKQWLDAVNSEE